MQVVNLCVLSNNTVRANELPGHLHVPTGLVDEGEVEGDLPGQIHLIIGHTLQKEEMGRGMDKKRERFCEATLLEKLKDG